MFIHRLLTAAVGVPLLAVLLITPEPIFAAVVEAILAVATFELVRCAQPKEGELTVPISAAATAALLVALTRTGLSPSVWVIILLAGVSLLMLIQGRNQFAQSLGGWWIGSVLYIGAMGVHFILLRDVEAGQRWLVILLATVFATDTGAYIVGRLIGHRKMAPTISPNKTWEGAVGGYLVGVITALITIVAVQVDPQIKTITDIVTGEKDRIPVITVALGTPIAAMIGDLVESALKRRVAVKDISQILPGYGGVLDRLDSLLFAAPWIYWTLRWTSA